MTSEHNEYIPRRQLLQIASESPEIKHSPNASKAAGKRQQRQKPPQVPDEKGPLINVPKSSVGEYGVPSQVQFLLEVSSFNHYTPR